MVIKDLFQFRVGEYLILVFCLLVFIIDVILVLINDNIERKDEKKLQEKIDKMKEDKKNGF